MSDDEESVNLSEADELSDFSVSTSSFEPDSESSSEDDGKSNKK